MDYLQFKAELEMMGISTFENDEKVLRLYKLYLKEDKNEIIKMVHLQVNLLHYPF